MTPVELAAWSFPVLLALIFIRLPIGLSMAVCGLVGSGILYGQSGPVLNQLKHVTYGTFSNYNLSVIPLFLLMGQFAALGGLSQALFKAAEAWIRERLAVSYPDDGILGEEEGEQTGTTGYLWVIDPIDGTHSFVQGLPFYANLVSVEYEQTPVAGVIHFPAMGETIWGTRDLVEWQVGSQIRPARVSTVQRLADGLFTTTSPNYFLDEHCQPLYDELVGVARISRGLPDAYSLAAVITGRAEVCVEPMLKRWDISAAHVLVEGAGGRYTDMAGGRSYTSSVVSNGLIHDEVLTITKEYAKELR